MRSSINIGDQVHHYKFGSGTVKRLVYPNFAEVKFGQHLEYVEQNNLRLMSYSSMDGETREGKYQNGETRRIQLAKAKAEQARQEAKAKEERACLRAARRKKNEIQNAKKRELDRKNEAKRAEMIETLRERMQNEFLTVDRYYLDTCKGFVSEDDFKKEKVSFVKKWVSGHLRSVGNENVTVPDDDQAAAIAGASGNIQVIARAGSGKTATLVNRTIFLIQHCGIEPETILLLAFNTKAVVDIQKQLLAAISEKARLALTAEIDRNRRTRFGATKSNAESKALIAVSRKLSIRLPHVMTFHALAYGIVHPEESLLSDGPGDRDQSFSLVVQRVIDDHLQDEQCWRQIRTVMLAHCRSDWERITEGHYDADREGFLSFRRSLKEVSLDGKYVKSFGEKVIADFLLEHDISYKYENNEWFEGFNYRPDFTIFRDDNSKIIIEYFGLKGDPDYDQSIDQKRAYWEGRPRDTLLEIFPSDLAKNGEDGFVELLKSRLERLGVRCVRLSEDEIWHKVKDRAIDCFTNAITGFIGVCRKQSIDLAGLERLINNNSVASPVERAFHEVAYQIYGAYLKYLEETGEDDFDGLMQRAGNKVHEGVSLAHRRAGVVELGLLRHVCIDEFQDFSDLFYRLIDGIRKINDRVRFFCVGDSWQSINGFAGSQLKYFENFDSYFEDSTQFDITTNYRSETAIVAIGNNLMQGKGSPSKAHKKSKGSVLLLDTTQFDRSLVEKEKYPYDLITPAVLRVINKGLADGLNVVMLTRTNAPPSGIYRAKCGKDIYAYADYIRSFFPEEMKSRITGSTAHKYKGLQKSMVILLDGLASKYPLVHPDWVFSKLFGNTLEKVVEEERRLLYVALTRAEEKLIIVTDDRMKSPFISELEHKQTIPAIDWRDYPPMTSGWTRYVVKVMDQVGLKSRTYNVKDLLKANGYLWQGRQLFWAKSFPIKGFHNDLLKKESWSRQADGIKVSVCDGAGQEVVQYSVDGGQWYCVSGAIDPGLLQAAQPQQSFQIPTA